jgi:hypothetical protein
LKSRFKTAVQVLSERDLDLLKRSLGLEGGVEEKRIISQNEKKTAKITCIYKQVCHVLLVKDGCAGLR